MVCGPQRDERALALGLRGALVWRHRLHATPAFAPPSPPSIAPLAMAAALGVRLPAYHGLVAQRPLCATVQPAAALTRSGEAGR